MATNIQAEGAAKGGINVFPGTVNTKWGAGVTHNIAPDYLKEFQLQAEPSLEMRWLKKQHGFHIINYNTCIL